MAKTAQKIAVAMVLGAILAVPGTSAAADATTASLTTGTELGHVRSSSPAIAALIQRAAEYSATFRGLVETIDASDSYVYVDEGDCGRGIHACFISVTTAGPSRFMRVKVDTREADWDLMGSIGHELRHTIEAISDPSVRSNAEKYFLYERIGMHSAGGGRETMAAMDTGNAVRSEVRKFNRQAKAE